MGGVAVDILLPTLWTSNNLFLLKILRFDILGIKPKMYCAGAL